MSNIVVLDSKVHASLRVDAAVSARNGDNQRFVPVVLAEFPFVAVHYPILLSKDAETGAFYCGAMMGFDEGENLFLAEQAAQTVYRPLNLRRSPFFAAGNGLALDLDHPRVRPDGQALFSDSGKPSVYVETVVAVLRELKAGAEAHKGFTERLVALKLVEPIELDLAFDDGRRRKVTGLYTIDQEALAALPDEAVLELFRKGYLQAAHLLAGSLKQVPLLAQRKNRQLLDPTAPLASAAV